MNILVTVCARGGSKGLPGKNIKPLLGKPLILHTIDLALKWPKGTNVWVSTDSKEIADVAKTSGIEIPILRPKELAEDSTPKMPVLTHALKAAEAHFKKQFDFVVDLDPTSPIRRLEDIEKGWEHFNKTNCEICFSVVRARKNPYFNMVERDAQGNVKLVRPDLGGTARRQAAPQVYDMNASVYIFKRQFLINAPTLLWEGKTEFFEMPVESGFDIDEQRDFIVTEAMMKYLADKN